jgi:vacuolar-type H+-ATPase subunit E/Vma4
MKDIAPELLEKIKKDFEKKLKRIIEKAPGETNEN